MTLASFVPGLGVVLLLASLLAACTRERVPAALPASEPTTAASATVGGAPATAATAPPKVVLDPALITPETQAALFPTATPMAIPRARFVDGVPEGAVGPLLVYSRSLRHVAKPGRTISVTEVVTFDLGTGRPVASFDFGEDPLAGVAQLHLAGRELVLNGWDGTRPVARIVGLDGTQLRTFDLPPSLFPGRTLPSPDGRLYARDVEGGLVIGEVATGRVLHRVEGPRPPDEPLAPVTWSTDGAWVVAQAVNPHRSSGLWLLGVDGTLRELVSGGRDAQWHVTDDGRFALLLTEVACPDGGSQVGSFCESTGRGFVVRELLTNLDVGRVAFGGLAHFWLRATVGQQLLYTLERPVAGRDLETGAAWEGVRTEWHVLDLQTGQSTAITDLAALESGRVSPWRMVLRCSRELLPLPLRTPAQSFACDQVTVDGTVVASGRELNVLGVIEMR